MSNDCLPQELIRQFVLINDDSKFKRRKALEKIKEETVDKINSFEKDALQNLLSASAPHLINAIFDSAEKHRETSIEILQSLIEKVDIIDSCLPNVVPALNKRLGQQQIIEESEEVRLSLLNLLLTIINKIGKQNAVYIDEFTNILIQTLIDPYPEVKKLSCKCACSLAKSVPQYFYHKSELLVKPLIKGINHQHSRVRVEIIYAIGDVLQNGNGKNVPDVITHLAQRLFDDSPNVRQAVIQIVGNWLLDLIDRYSFHHSLIPLLLTGLTDEQDEIKTLANDLWYDTGMKYEKENENDLKDSLDFQKPALSHYPSDVERPNLGCRVLIFRNLSRILPALMRDLNDWVANTRIKAAQLLPHLLVNAEECCTQHVELLFSGISKGMADEEIQVRKGLERAAYIAGFFVEPQIWWKLIGVAVSRGDTGVNLLAGYLSTLANIIEGSEPGLLVATSVAKEIADKLTNEEIAHSYAANVKWPALLCIEHLINLLAPGNKDCLKESCSSLFYATLSIQAVIDSRQPIETTMTITNKCRTIFHQLALSIELSDVAQLYTQEMPKLLQTFKQSCSTWIVQSSNRLVFDSLLLEAGPVTGEFIDDIMAIFAVCLNNEKEPEFRLKFFILLAKLVANVRNTLDSKGKFKNYLSSILEHLILPNCIWRAGRTAEAVRKIAASTLWAVLTGSSLILQEQDQTAISCEGDADQQESRALSSLSTLPPSLLMECVTRTLSLMDEDNKGTRLVACRCMILVLKSCIAPVTDDNMDRDALHQIYPNLLKRLDDPEDEIRILNTKVILTWLAVLAPKFEVRLYSAHLSDIYSNLLVHLDDSEESVKAAVYQVLLEAGKLDFKLLEESVLKVRERHRSQRLLDKLMDEVKAVTNVDA